MIVVQRWRSVGRGLEFRCECFGLGWYATVNDQVFAMLQLSEEINQLLEAVAPLVAFFGLPEKEQIAILPVLEERKYDFPEGDLLTSDAREVLVSGYKTCLNSILIRLRVIQDESEDWVMGDFANLVESLLQTTHKITEEQFEGIDYVNRFETAEWKSLRRLSSAVQRQLEMQVVINPTIVENCVEYWLHP